MSSVAFSSKSSVAFSSKLSTGVLSIYFSFGISKFQYSGVLSGLVADFFLDMFSIYGCLIFIGAPMKIRHP